MTEWITYVRSNRAGEITTTKRKDEPKGYGTPRPATATEVRAEVARRDAQNAETARIRAFNTRPDVQDARSIASRIEMDIEDVIDALTPAEWAEIRARLDKR